MTFLGEADFLHVSTGFWVSVKRFELSADLEDRELLRNLVGVLEYQDPYDAPLELARFGVGHGPYRTSAVTDDLFEPVPAERAALHLQRWFDACGYPDDALRAEQFDSVVLARLSLGNIYELPALPPSTWWGEVRIVGVFEGFNEFVVINRCDREVLVIVASDD